MYYDEPDRWCDTMVVCVNGHKITGMAKRHPEDMKKHCPRCGAETMSRCPSCNTEIPGYLHIRNVVYADGSRPPEHCHECGGEFPWTGKRPEPGVRRRDALDALLRILSRFHRVVRQLRDRHDSRPTLEIEDEYDIQDLLHALLVLEFDDIRREEWTPSYAGGSARMDFLLKDPEIVVEAKKTRSGLGAKEVGEQLLVDIAKYKKHPNCKTLVCFVYDPEGRVGNASGLCKDLEKCSSEELRVVSYIYAP